jgi:hypothetical protein
MFPAYRLPTVFAFSESYAVCLISGVASSQNLRSSGGTMPDVTMMIALRGLPERGRGQRGSVSTRP